ncbi:MAG: transcription antitermination factor NusB [Candidatus Omnitrophota bacterium]
MRKRTHAREVALKVLYQLDISRQEFSLKIEDTWCDEEKLELDVAEFADFLVRGVHKHFKEIDGLIVKYATNWQLKRMAVIDRNILRLGVFELMFSEDIPAKVSINEAIDLAKKYGDADSGKFVNGVLDKINKTHKKKCQEDS